MKFKCRKKTYMESCKTTAFGFWKYSKKHFYAIINAYDFV